MTKKSLLCLLIFASGIGCSSQTNGSTPTTGGGGSLGAAGRPNAAGTAGAVGAIAGAGGLGSSGALGTGGAPSNGGAGAGGGGMSGIAGGSSGGAAAGAGSGSAGASTGGATGGSAGGASDAPVDAKKMVSALGFGTNIGNTLENTAAWETGWGQPLITQAYINGMASRGIKTVRVPVAWDTYASNGVIDPTKMARVKEVVGWIDAAGMYSLVNIHWDGGWIDNDTDNNPNRYQLSADVKSKFASYWTQIATAFSTVGHRLILEGLNEESKFYLNGDTSKPDYAALNTLNQLFVTTVRAQAGYSKTRALLIAGFTTDIALTCVSSFSIPNDPAGAGKLFLSLHYYTPYTFCGLDSVESWGSPQTTWGTTADKSELDRLFTQLATCSTDKNVPVILGEFAVTPGDKYPRDPASRTAWMTAVGKACFARKIVPLLWDTGSEISRTDGSFATTFKSVIKDSGY